MRSTELAMSPDSAPAPQLWRRLACTAYEMLLLLGVIAFVVVLPMIVAGAASGAGLPTWVEQIYLLIVVGVYFVWFWTHGGQTLAMKTWKIRLVAANGKPPSRGRAVTRYLLSWLWLAPGAAFALLVFNLALWLGMVHGHHAGMSPAINYDPAELTIKSVSLLLFGLLFWPLTAKLGKGRALNDRLAGTWQILG